MEFTIDNLESAVCQFYQSDSILQPEVHQWLTEASASIQAWNFVWDLLQLQKRSEVQFYGATTLYNKIERFLNELNPEQILALKGKLLSTIINFGSGPKMVQSKLFTCLSAYLLQTCPELWPGAVPELLATFTPENVPQIPADTAISILLELLTGVPKELSTIYLTQNQRGLVRHHLNENNMLVLNLLEKIISNHNDHEIITQAVKCVSSWIEIGLPLSQCQNMTNILIGLVFNTYKQHPSICENALDALGHLVNQPDAGKYPASLLELLTKILPLQEIVVRELMSPEPDEVIKTDELLKIELFRTQQFFIFVKGEYSLWWDRTTGELTAKTGWDLASAVDPECLGICFGIVGKIQLESIVEPRLMLIKEYDNVGEYVDGHNIFKVKSVVLLHHDDNDSLHLPLCKKHQSSSFTKKGSFFDQKSTFAKTLGAVKFATNSIKTSTQQAAALAMPQVKFKFGSKDKEKYEKRLLEELQKIFFDTDSFYFSITCDLTNSLQRTCKKDEQSEPLWKNVDDRFFWNKYMLHDLINSNNSLYDPWILPVIQGFVQIETCGMKVDCDIKTNEVGQQKNDDFKLIIISRRSRYRAGTRYKRRGVDENGYCANYVETEQILTYQHHKVSFVQTRGSVPVFWSQPGYKYKPPPRIDRGTTETQIAFEKHFERELESYGPVCVVNLVEQSGKEKIIWDAYTNHILTYNNPDVTYASFDFHEYCRGMRFENVSYLISSLEDVIRSMHYSWTDRHGTICTQKGVFRVNCIDCLDRTNVVQTALAKIVMEIQLTKLGLIIPEGQIPHSVKSTFQLLWANNGDVISKQYAGTNALKGDYTRTGERKFTGLMKDGMNSANRYYLSRFKDAYRQATIDMMLGNDVTEDLLNTDQKQDEEDKNATAEHVKLLIEDCKKLLINNLDLIVGSWGLIDADPVTGDPSETEMDTILILTKESYYVAEYDEQIDKVTKYQKIDLKDVKMIELGPISTSSQMSSVFKLNRSNVNNQFCMRIHYAIGDEGGYFHMFRSTNLRFFNNMTVHIKSSEEMLESLKAICETFLVALEVAGLPSVLYAQGRPLEKKKSKVLEPENSCRLGSYLHLGLTQGLTRNVSETQLVNLRSAGSKALSNITQQFSKINKLGQSLRRNHQPKVNSGLKDTPLPPVFSIESVDSSRVSPRSRRSSDASDDGCESASLKVNAALRDKHMHFPNVGVLMKNEPKKARAIKSEDIAPLIGKFSLSRVVESENLTSRQKSPLLHSRTDALFDPKKLELSLKSCKRSVPTKEPEDSGKVSLDTNNLQINRQLSHSANEIEEGTNKKNEIIPQLTLTLDKRCNSEKDLTLNMVSSQSENALRSLKNNIANAITSPVSVTRDMLSPFSKFAKGMHNLGANLDPRKLKSHSMEPAYRLSDSHLEEIKRLEERWKNSKTKLIAL